jgi:hypothetical protein
MQGFHIRSLCPCFYWFLLPVWTCFLSASRLETSLNTVDHFFPWC